MSFISGLNKNCFFKQKTLSCDLCFMLSFGDAENFKLFLSKITNFEITDDNLDVLYKNTKTITKNLADMEEEIVG